jgi:hypothetical protein
MSVPSSVAVPVAMRVVVIVLAMPMGMVSVGVVSPKRDKACSGSGG